MEEDEEKVCGGRGFVTGHTSMAICSTVLPMLAYPDVTSDTPPPGNKILQGNIIALLDYCCIHVQTHPLILLKSVFKSC